MTNRILLLAASFLVALSGCGSDRGITFSEPNGSTVWTSEELFHAVDWSDEEGHMTLGEGSLLLLYKGDKAVKAMEIWAPESGEGLVVMYPQGIAEGSDYRLWFQDEEKREGYSDFFTITR